MKTLEVDSYVDADIKIDKDLIEALSRVFYSKEKQEEIKKELTKVLDPVMGVTVNNVPVYITDIDVCESDFEDCISRMDLTDYIDDEAANELKADLKRECFSRSFIKANELETEIKRMIDFDKDLPEKYKKKLENIACDLKDFCKWYNSEL